MPFDSDRALIFLDQVRKILEFQSTVDILKRMNPNAQPIYRFKTNNVLEPPSGYQMPSTDLLGGIDSIISKVKSSGYSNQFEMDLDVSNVINSAHDGHLAFQLCSQSIFSFSIDLPLVSISSDGLALPEVYTLSMPIPCIHPLTFQLTHGR